MIDGKFKIVCDENIPFLEGVFEPYATVLYKNGAAICREDLMDTDVLLIRTRTRCNAALLEGTSVTFIATATIGMDHIDTDYCARRGITVVNSAGCNSGGVLQYVFSALYGAASHNSINLKDKVFGIIGVGHVGRRIEEMARYLGFEVLLCDPPRAAAEGGEGFVSMEYLLEHSDIVTLHTPLDSNTIGMAGESFFRQMKLGSVFINAARGEIVDEQALLDAAPKFGAIIIDTWNNEPDINRELLEVATVATPHIAGYSYQGKMNGTAMAVQAIARKYGIFQLYNYYPRELPEDVPQKLDLSNKTQGEITATFQYNYPIFADDFMLRTQPENFEQLRQNYNFRREIYI